MSKRHDLAVVLNQKLEALYASGDERKIAMFEALQRKKAEERGEDPDLAMPTILKVIGAFLNETQRENSLSRDEAVEARETQSAIIENLSASGKSPEEIVKTLSFAKQVGELMTGIGVTPALDTSNNLSLPNNKPLAPTLPDR